MYILTGSFDNNDNIWVTYKGSPSTTILRATTIDENGEEILLGEVKAVKTLPLTEEDELLISQNPELESSYKRDIKIAEFLVFEDEDKLSQNHPLSIHSSDITDMPNLNTATSEEIINYVIENDPLFSNLKLI